MTSSIWQTTAAACVVVVLSSAGYGSAARAQATDNTTSTTGTTGSVGSAGSVQVGQAGQAGRARVSGGVGASGPQLSAAEQGATADAIVARGNTLSQRVAQMLDEARREADMIRVTCLNDKLTQINANLRTAQGRLVTLQRTLDVDQRNHELTVLTVLGQKLQVLDQESNQCVGQDLYETGPTKVITEIDTSILPFESDPTNPQILTPTSPTTLGVMDASSNGAPPG